MICENNFCIYCDNSNCILDSISLNEIGMCIECIHISLDYNTLKAEKEKLLNKYEKEENISYP